MSTYTSHPSGPFVLSANISPGGIPKRPIAVAMALKSGLEGDRHNHAKHIRPDRAVSLWDDELLRQIAREGFSLSPGAAGENLTVLNLHVQDMLPGTLLQIGQAVIKLEQPRKPCYVLDAIDPRLKDVVAGRFGYLASVVEEGTIEPGMPIEVISSADASDDSAPASTVPESHLIEELPGSRTYHLLAGPGIG